MTNLSKKIIDIVLMEAVLVVIASLWWKQRTVDSRDNLGAVSQVGDSQPAVAEKVSLTVEDQFPGTIVFVSAVELPKGGWVVVSREESGQPGRVVGAGYFAPGVTTGEVNLAIATGDGESYVAELYRDNGDTSFNIKTDQAYLDLGGQSVRTSFTVTRNLIENKG